MADLFSLQDIMGLGGYPNAPPADLGQPYGGGGGLTGLLGSQRMIGLGMGLLAGNQFDRWGPAMKGYQVGASEDLKAQQLERDRALRQQQLAMQRAGLDREPEGIRQLRAMGIDPTSDQAREMLYPKTEDWIAQTWTDPNTEIAHPYRVNRKTGALEWLNLPGVPPPNAPAQAPGGAAAPGPGAGNFSAGGVPYASAEGQPTAEPLPPTTAVAGGPPIPGAAAPPSLIPTMPPEIAALPPSLRKKYQGDIAVETAKTQMKQTAAEPAKKADAENVIANIDRALEITDNRGGSLPTTGAGGQVLQYVGGTAAHDLASKLSSIKAATAFGKLQEMRNANPNGAGLGQVSNFEDRMLSNSIDALDQSQSKDEFKANLRHVRSVFQWIVGRNDPNEPPPPPPKRAAYGAQEGGGGKAVAAPAQDDREAARQELIRRGVIPQ